MPTTVSKSREANELRARAKTVWDQILNPDWKDANGKPMDGETFKAKKEEFDTLSARANMLAEFTPKHEVQRQGGDHGAVVEDEEGETRVDEMRRVDGPGTRGRLPALTRKDMPRGGWHAKAKEIRDRVLKEFKNPNEFLRATWADRGVRENLTDSQRSALDELQMITRTIVGTAGDTSGAEYLLPLQQEQAIFMIENEQYGLLQNARRYSVSGRTLRIPYVRQTDPSNARPTSGIANVTIIGEAGTKPFLEPAFSQRVLTMFKYAAAAQIGDETISDDFTGDVQPVVTALVGGQVMNAMNEHMTIDGTGVGMPLGALNSANPALMTLDRATASSFTTGDAFTMYSYHTHGPNSFWLVSRRTMPYIFNLSLPSGTTGSAFVTFLTDLRGKPGATLLGIPVIESDLLPTAGQTGDINLVNPDFYAVGLRAQLTVEKLDSRRVLPGRDRVSVLRARRRHPDP